MRINKNELTHALVALGKLISRTSQQEVCKAVRIQSNGNKLVFTVTAPTESLSVEIAAEGNTNIDKIVYYSALRDAFKGSADGTAVFAEVHGVFSVQVTAGRRIQLHALPEVDCKWPELQREPDKVIAHALPEGFVSMLLTAAPVVDRNETRRQLQGINLSRDGIAVTNGKELLNVPVDLSMDSLTLPFPLALMATKEKCGGTLKVWTTNDRNPDTLFRISLGAWTWYGKAIEGKYPDWRQVIPNPAKCDYLVHWEKAVTAELLAFVKRTAAEHYRLSFPDAGTMQLAMLNDDKQYITVKSVVTGKFQGRTLDLGKAVLEHLLVTGQTTVAVAYERSPILATGGTGRYIAMPLCTAKPHPVTTASETKPINKEDSKMSNENNVVTASALRSAARNDNTAAVNPLDELGTSIEALKLKLKAMFDESAILSRKVREAQLLQKQKERDFVQARRAIERIRSVSGF